MDDASLCQAALAARDGAHVPYSGFRVGAALLCEDGALIRAANLENASLGLSVCAERNAVAAAVMAGKTHIEAVAVVADDNDPTPPCGGCRQVLHEFGPGMLVVAEADNGRRAEWVLSALLPAAFDSSSLRDR